MIRSLSAAAIALAAGVSAFAASGTQGAAQPAPPTFETSIVNTWKRLHDKILAMASSRIPTPVRRWTSSGT